MTNQTESPDAELDAILDFTPVARKNNRVDGWSPERQRAFIHALALTGSPRRAAAAVGKAQWGAEQLRKAPDAESFNAAWDAALSFARDKGSRRIAAGLQVVEDQDAAWSPPLGAWGGAATRAHLQPPPEPSEAELDQADQVLLELLDVIAGKYMIKLGAERRARLEGRIAEADFYLRQITCLEVSLDMVSGDGMKILRDYRCRGHDLLTIAETPMSQLLDAARRDHWREMGEPPRPEHPPRHLLVEHDGFSAEPLEATYGGLALTHDQQRQAFDAQHAKDAKEQVEWEAEQRRAYDRRRDSDAGS
jgi:hypothetical protein